MNGLEKTILVYLKERSSSWMWMNGVQMFSKEKTIRLFKKDRKFRKMITEEVHKLAVDLFVRGSGKGK